MQRSSRPAMIAFGSLVGALLAIGPAPAQAADFDASTLCPATSITIEQATGLLDQLDAKTRSAVDAAGGSTASLSTVADGRRSTYSRSTAHGSKLHLTRRTLTSLDGLHVHEDTAVLWDYDYSHQVDVDGDAQLRAFVAERKVDQPVTADARRTNLALKRLGTSEVWLRTTFEDPEDERQYHNPAGPIYLLESRLSVYYGALGIVGCSVAGDKLTLTRFDGEQRTAVVTFTDAGAVAALRLTVQHRTWTSTEDASMTYLRPTLKVPTNLVSHRRYSEAVMTGFLAKFRHGVVVDAGPKVKQARTHAARVAALRASGRTVNKKLQGLYQLGPVKGVRVSSGFTYRFTYSGWTKVRGVSTIKVKGTRLVTSTRLL